MGEVREYHLIQYKAVYETTKALIDFFTQEHGEPSGTISDVACGAGANTFYLASRFPGLLVSGCDIDAGLIAVAYRHLAELGQGIANPPRFFQSDIFSPSFLAEAVADCVFAFQCLCWIPADDIYSPLERVARIAHKSLAFSCLIYDGPVDAKIHIDDWSNPHSRYSVPYNVLSLERIRTLLSSLGFEKVAFRKWVMPFKLTTTSQGVGSRTVDTVDGERLLVSGPLLLPYAFVVAQK